MATLAYLEGQSSTNSTVTQDLLIDDSGTIFKHSQLSGGYHAIAHISDFGINNVDELHGREGIEELDGTLGKGFKFKMKAPKMPKIKAPKMPKMKAPKMKVNTKGLSKGISNVGKSASNAYKSYQKANVNLAKGIGKGLSSIGKGVGQFAESLLSDGQGQVEEQAQETEESIDETENESLAEDIGNESLPEDIQTDSVEENIDFDNTIGCQINQQGKLFRYSPIEQKLVELSGEHLGAITDLLTSFASSGGSSGGGKSGLLSLATTGLDMVAPGAGSVAKMGIGMAQKQKAAQAAKKKAQKAKQDALYKKLIQKKKQAQTQIKIKQQTPIKPKVSQISTSTKSPTYRNEINNAITDYNQSQSFQASSRPKQIVVRSQATNPTVKEQSDYSAVTGEKNNSMIFVIFGAGILLFIMSSNKKEEKEK